MALRHSQTPAQFGAILRWMHVVFLGMTVSVAWFVRIHLRAGRLGLVWTTCGMRALAMLVNLFCPLIPNFLETTQLKRAHLWNEEVSVPVGVNNPLVLLRRWVPRFYWL